jgi:hypothetical protein
MNLNFSKLVTLASVALAGLIEPAFAGTTVPGPIAGIGLPALVLIGGAYWLGRKLLARKR